MLEVVGMDGVKRRIGVLGARPMDLTSPGFLGRFGCSHGEENPSASSLGKNGKEIEVYEDDEEDFLEIEEQKKRREWSSLHTVTVDLPTFHIKREQYHVSRERAVGRCRLTKFFRPMLSLAIFSSAPPSQMPLIL